MIVDPGKLPIVSDFDLWHHVMCRWCKRQLGLLANVESIEPYNGKFHQEQERLWRTQSH